MKKIAVILLWIIAFIWAGTVFARSYSFNHYPATVSSTSFANNAGYELIKFSWKGSARFNRVNIDDIQAFGEQLEFVKFFKFSYYWGAPLDKIRDQNIDLSYLYKTKLAYPIAAYYTQDTLFLLIHENNLNLSDRRYIQESYNGSNLQISKYGSWYLTSKKYKSTGGMVYKFSTYFSLLKGTYSGLPVVQFVLWDSPFESYKIEGFSDNNLQIEIMRGEIYNGLIFNLDKKFTRYTSKPVDKDYDMDVEMQNELYSLHNSIQNYYKNFGDTPSSLGSLAPEFLDITAFNLNDYDFSFSKKTNKCVEMWFKPKSTTFKNLNFINMVDGYWTTSYCIY